MKAAVRPAVFLLVSTAFVTGATPAGTSGPHGRVVVRVTDHREGIADFAALEMAVAEVALHARGYPRGHGWTAVVGPAPPSTSCP